MATPARPTKHDTARVFAQVDVRLEDRGDHWAGWIEQMGTFVYGKDIDEVKARAKLAMQEVARYFGKADAFSAYLRRKGVPRTTDRDNAPTASCASRSSSNWPPADGTWRGRVRDARTRLPGDKRGPGPGHLRERVHSASADSA